MRNINSVTPGELLKEEFLEPMGISQYRLAKEIGVPAQRIGQIIAGKTQIFGFAVFLDFPMATGCGLRQLTTQKLQKMPLKSS